MCRAIGAMLKPSTMCFINLVLHTGLMALVLPCCSLRMMLPTWHATTACKKSVK